MTSDLYSKLCHRQADEAIRAIFGQLAAQERRHARVVLRALDTLASEGGEE